MKRRYLFALLPIFLSPLSCSANNGDKNTIKTVNTLMEYYLSSHVKPGNNNQYDYKLGDFNGDGVEDMVVLFKPVSKPGETTQLKVSAPWVYPGSKPSSEYHKSIAIFNGSKESWKSDKTRVFVLLDNLGVLETPSFELLVSKKTDKDYTGHVDMLPIKLTNDLIVLPTEAGIDTYIYWEKGSYHLFEPEEMP